MKRIVKTILPPLPQRAARMLARLKHVRGMSDEEKSVHALGLAATPEERWQLNENFVRSLGYWTPQRGRCAKRMILRDKKLPFSRSKNFKSKDILKHEEDLLHVIYMRNFLRCQRALKSQPTTRRT